MTKKQTTCEHYFACALCGEEQKIEERISQEKEKWINSIKNHKFTLYSARKALVEGNFVLPEEKTVDVFDYNELLDLLDK